MKIVLDQIDICTRGNTDIHDITRQVGQRIEASGVSDGLVTVFCPSSTSGVTTIEYEPGVLQDLQHIFDLIVPREYQYRHDQAWHDGNGHSHVRSAILKASLSVPFSNGRMILGTWQQIVYIDFDNRPRKREIIIQIMGE